MSLREKISNLIVPPVFGQDPAQRLFADGTADAILALVRAHLTSDEAVKRGLRRWYEDEEIPLFDDWIEDFRAAILAALGEGE